MTNKPIAISFFSGALGLDLGIESAGFAVVLACEKDKHCRETIKANRPDMPLITEVSGLTAEDVRGAAGLCSEDNIDLIFGGPPCQSFSTAGKRRGLSESRGNIFLDFIDLCVALNPSVFVIENVRGLLSCPGPGDEPEKGGALALILEIIRASGYGVSFSLYNAANFGAPQMRDRVVMVCTRDGPIAPHLKPTHAEGGAYGLLPWVTFREATLGVWNKAGEGLSFPEKRMKYYRMLTEGQNWRNLPDDVKEAAMGGAYNSGGGKTGFYRRLYWDKPAPTLLTHPAMPATDLAHPFENRPLSVKEYKRLQEFPDSWEVCGPILQQYKQIGNAVPLSLGRAIGQLVKEILSGDFEPRIPGFKHTRYKNTCHETWAKG